MFAEVVWPALNETCKPDGARRGILPGQRPCGCPGEYGFCLMSAIANFDLGLPAGSGDRCRRDDAAGKRWKHHDPENIFYDVNN